LSLFGIDIPAHPTWEQVQAEYEAVWQTLEGVRREPDRSAADDRPELQAAVQLLLVLTAPAYFTDFHSFA